MVNKILARPHSKAQTQNQSQQKNQNEFTRISEPQFVSLGDNRYIFTNWQRGA